MPGSAKTNDKDRTASTLFEQVYHRYRRVLLKYFHRKSVHSAEVEELVQETYLRLVANPHGAALDYAEAYLFAIAANIANDWHRSRLIREALMAAVLPTQRSEDSEPINAERIVMAREEAQRVAAAHCLQRQCCQSPDGDGAELGDQSGLCCQLGIYRTHAGPRHG